MSLLGNTFLFLSLLGRAVSLHKEVVRVGLTVDWLRELFVLVAGPSSHLPGDLPLAHIVRGVIHPGMSILCPAAKIQESLSSDVGLVIRFRNSNISCLE